MPVALRAADLDCASSSSSLPRSRVPREGAAEFFFAAVFAPAPLGLAGAFFSSSASKAAFSAFLAAASAALAAAASLWHYMSSV